MINQAKPDAIIVAMPARFFQEYTMEKFLQDIENMNTIDNFVWYRVMKNLPKIQTPYCYWIIDGKVKYRMDIAKLVRNKTYRFARPKGGIATFENANCIELVGPVITAPYDIPMRGFQGFRYSELIF